jgi:cystathionine beta-lyase/cystathionine gamma-synthase
MLEFLIDNIFVIFGGRVFQQTVGMPMGTNCIPLLADLFLYSYEAEFIHELLKKNEKKLARSFNFTFRYIDDVLDKWNISVVICDTDIP